MLDDPALLIRLLSIFRSEYDEYSIQLQSIFKSWEQNNLAPELFLEAFRTAHNLKGAAGAVGLMPITHLAHAFETLLQKIRAQEQDFDGGVIDIGYAFLHQIEEWLASDIDWEADQDSPVTRSIEAWLSGTYKPQTPAPRPLPNETEFVRIPLAKLESILSDVNELTLAQHRMAFHLTDVETAFQQLHALQKDLKSQERSRFRHFYSWFRGHRSQLLADQQLLELAIGNLSAEAHSLRLVPLGPLFDWLDRQVRDLAQRLDKKIRLQLSGGETHLDRRIVEAVRDPLMHLVRNAVDHGVGTPAIRQAAGKDPTGSISLSAAQNGQTIVIEVADDGAGVDWSRVKARAQQLGWLQAQEAAELAPFLFRPGFSTREEASEISGRGFGLDIVEASIEALHGHVELHSQAGRGTRFILTVPLTQASLQSLLVECAGQTFAIGIAAVEKVVSLVNSPCEKVGANLTLRLPNAQLLPLIQLADLLGLPNDGGEPLYALILSAGHNPVGILIDRVVGSEDLIVKSLGPFFANLSKYAGGAVREDGQVVLLLNSLELVKGGRPSPVRTAALKTPPLLTKKRILVVDDSITSRTLEKSILENAGYEVVTASNGEEGLRLAKTSACQLIISDVEMPRLDGFQMTRLIKSDPALSHLRIVLVTSLAGEADRAKGEEAGADAYVVKGLFDQSQFLTLVARLSDDESR